jgi:hypothetical protein
MMHGGMGGMGDHSMESMMQQQMSAYYCKGFVSMGR